MIRFHSWLIPVLVTVGGVADLTSHLTSARRPGAPDAAILTSLDQFYAGELECGALALTQATRPDVKAMVQRLHQDHLSLRAAEREVSERLGISLTLKSPSAVADSHPATLADLKAMKSPDFDRAYVEHDIGVHQLILDQLAKSTEGSGPSPDVKALLGQTITTIKAHLDMAKSTKQQFKA